MRFTCALTGHRDLPSDMDKNAVYDGLETLVKEGCDSFLCGMAEGFDLLALECLVDLKKKYKLYIEACIPYQGHERRFASDQKRKFNELLEWCDVKTVLFEGYRDGCYLARNRYMVDCADMLFAYCKREKGGSAYTVKYAEKKGKRVVFL